MPRGEGPLRFGPRDCEVVRDDDSMLLALFHAAAANDFALVQRLAGT